MGKLKAGEEVALRALRDRILLTLRFVENAQGFKYGQGVREATNAAFVKQSLRSMKLIAREIDAMTIGLTSDERDGLDALLSDRLGVDKADERVRQSQQVAAVLRRGSIASEKERRRLEDYADMLEATGGDLAEAERVRTLLREA